METLIHDMRSKALTDNEFKKAREAWILAVTLLGINKGTEQLWWLQVPKEDPPDMYAMTIVANEKKDWNELQSREIEIMQITKFSDREIEEEILRKLNNKFYIKETGLVVYLNKKATIKDINALSDNIKSKNPRISDIWLLIAVSSKLDEFAILKVFPDIFRLSFNINEELARIPAGDTVEFTKNKGTKIYLVQNQPMTRFIP